MAKKSIMTKNRFWMSEFFKGLDFSVTGQDRRDHIWFVVLHGQNKNNCF